MTAPLCINRRAAGLRCLAPLAPLAVLLALGGCKSAQEWREEADRVGEAYLSNAQKQVSGHTEPINIETPADTLRRRLLLDQNLMISDSASFGIRDLPANRYWRAESRLNPGEPGGAVEFAPEAGEILEISLLDAVRIAAHNSRDYQQAKEELFSAALALSPTRARGWQRSSQSSPSVAPGPASSSPCPTWSRSPAAVASERFVARWPPSSTAIRLWPFRRAASPSSRMAAVRAAWRRRWPRARLPTRPSFSSRTLALVASRPERCFSPRGRGSRTRTFA